MQISLMYAYVVVYLGWLNSLIMRAVTSKHAQFPKTARKPGVHMRQRA